MNLAYLSRTVLKDFETFLHTMQQRVTTGDQDKETREAFKVFDRDNNDFISAPELRQIMASMGEKLTNTEVVEMLEGAYRNEDGRIDRV